MVPLTVPSGENVTWIVPGPVTPCCLQLARIAFFSASAARAADALKVGSAAWVGVGAVVAVGAVSAVFTGAVAVSVGGGCDGAVVGAVVVSGGGGATAVGTGTGAAVAAASSVADGEVDALVGALAEDGALGWDSERAPGRLRIAHVKKNPAATANSNPIIPKRTQSGPRARGTSGGS